jgi:molybdopterin/thiamine biosynthesis adenylyltransferase
MPPGNENDPRRTAASSELEARYSRQMLFEPIGAAGQSRLAQSRVVLVGCGALGSVLADTLVRAGVGFLRIIDRDFLELNNLQRQVLFDEHDLAAGLPKAEAAARKLRRINSTIEIEPLVADLNPGSAEPLCTDVHLILDGTDNFETRFLINDVAVKHAVPWIYGACIAAEGMVMPILPGSTPCLRCLWEDAPPPGTTPTCDTVGVLAPVVHVVASLQAVEAIKILTGRLEEVSRRLTTVDVWSGRWRSLDMSSAQTAGECPCCRQKRYEFLAGERLSSSTTLCGRNAVQILPPPGLRADFQVIAGRLPASAGAAASDYMLKFAVEGFAVTLFPDGRAIIQGTSDASAARGVYARYIGS